MRILALVFLLFMINISSKNALTNNEVLQISDYDPYENNKSNVDQKQIESLFIKHVQQTLKEGPSNRFWPIFSDFFPLLNNYYAEKAANSSNVKKIFIKQLAAKQPISKISIKLNDASSSPFVVNSHGNKGLQTSSNARIIDAASTIGIQIARELSASAQTKQGFDVFNGNQIPSQFCPFQQTRICDPTSRFQTMDGSCNNLQKPWLGKAETPYKRYFQPAYQDGFDSPRTLAKSGNPLPNPRVISRFLFNDNGQISNIVTHLTALFGQFVGHDLTSAAVSSDSNGGALDCNCNNPNPACFPVAMPSNEDIMRMSCMRFTRSSAAFPTFDCNLGHREQLNLLTSFIDGTQVYGPTDQRALELRLMSGGLLKTSPGINSRPYLVQAQDNSCQDTNTVVKCFAAGEGRTNENLGLTGVQLLFLREHNRVATELFRNNPNWSDERLFQEARKVVIAIMQHIIYKEYLPSILGSNTAALFDLNPIAADGYYSGYSSDINPSISNEFAVAAFRFGHTLMRSQFGRFNLNNIVIAPSVNVSETIFRPVEAYNVPAGGLDSIFLSLVNEPAGQYDTHFIDLLQNHLFEFRLSDNSVIATDLGATNINRGRDHGIPSYNVIREKCGLPKANSFRDLIDVMTQDKIQALASVYESVDDIDYYVGGLSETPQQGAVIGPTFVCVIANQFKDLKRGDRFYYENGPSATSFTIEQLREIKKMSMAKLICNDFDVNSIQPNVFLLASPALNNGRVPCSMLQSMDFSKWRNF